MRISRATEILKAISNEIRLKILLIVFKLGPVCVCDIVRLLKIPQGSVSRNLSYLRITGLLLAERKNNVVFYSINKESIFLMRLVVLLWKNLKNELIGKQIEDFHKSR